MVLHGFLIMYLASVSLPYCFFLRRLSFCMVLGKSNNVHDHCLSALINRNLKESHMALHGMAQNYAHYLHYYIARHCLVSLHCTIPLLEIFKYKVQI